MIHKYHIIQLFLLFLPATIFAKTTIVINDQKGFENIQQQVLSCINSGEKKIYVKIARGTYIVKEKHLTLNQINSPDVKLHIVGKGAIFIPEGREYHNGDCYVGTYDVNNSWMNGSKDVEIWSHIHYVEGQVEVLDATEKRCRIKSKRTFPAHTDYSNAYILIPHWYQSSVYKIDKIDRQYIYFTADDLKESSYSAGYNVNDDYNYGKKNIRYKLCNVGTGDDCLRITNGKVHLPKDVTTAWEGKTHRFLTIQDCKLSAVEIKGIEFWSNAFAESNPAIYFKNTECKEIHIHKCGFYGMRGDVISITATPNVKIDNNKFEDCYYYGIKSDNASANTVVENNSFASMGKRMQNTFSIVCRGTDYEIKGNVMQNYGYGGIGVGVWYKSKQTKPSCGVVENNTLTYSSDYIKNIANYGIMDSGAIYLWTKNDGSIIRYNYIDGFSGAGDNRGIFCDDGASNFEIIGNVIVGIANSYCIDSRRCSKVEEKKTPNTGIEMSNINIVIRDNLIDGRIRFVGNEAADNGCRIGTNNILLPEGHEAPRITTNNVSVVGESVELNYTGKKHGCFELSKKSYKMLKKSPEWKKLKRFIAKEKR